MIRKHAHRPQRCPVERTHRGRAVHDVTDNLTSHARDERKQGSAISPQRVDDVAFVVLSEGTSVHLTNAWDVAGFLLSYFDHGRLCPVHRTLGISGSAKRLPLHAV